MTSVMLLTIIGSLVGIIYSTCAPFPYAPSILSGWMSILLLAYY